MRNYFTFGDIDSRDFGVFISGDGVYDSPQRIYTEVAVAGRNGTLLIDQGNFENISLKYPAFIAGSNWKQNLTNFRGALGSQIGYKDLIDTYHPTEIRQGCFMSAINVKPSWAHDAGSFDIEFNCKPERFLASGRETITLTASGTVHNPTPFPCKPILKVTGYGSLMFAVGHALEIIIENTYPEIEIDCETCNCTYLDLDNANDAVFASYQSGEFPYLRSGDTYISLGTTITKLEIIPRWYLI